MDSSNQEVFLSAIRALSENPESLKLLLENKPLNEAIAAYVNASAEALKPRSEWREVWQQTSDDVRMFAPPAGEMYFPYEQKEFKSVAILVAKWHESQRVVTAVGYISSHNNALWFPDMMAQGSRILLRSVGIFDAYGGAVEWAQGLWTDVLTEFRKRTQPLDEGGAS